MKKLLTLILPSLALAAGAPPAQAEICGIMSASQFAVGFGIHRDCGAAKYDIANPRCKKRTAVYDKDPYCGEAQRKYSSLACLAVAFVGKPDEAWATGWGEGNTLNEAVNEARANCRSKGVMGRCQVMAKACPG